LYTCTVHVNINIKRASKGRGDMNVCLCLGIERSTREPGGEGEVSSDPSPCIIYTGEEKSSQPLIINTLDSRHLPSSMGGWQRTVGYSSCSDINAETPDFYHIGLARKIYVHIH
jgi:hypothetical protein